VILLGLLEQGISINVSPFACLDTEFQGQVFTDSRKVKTPMAAYGSC
jgi:hypothetical protein